MIIRLPIKPLSFSLPRLKILLLALMLTACSSQPPSHFKQAHFKQPNKVPLTAEQQETKQALMDVYHKWQGTPFRLGGTNHRGIDCSAFVQRVYQQALGVNLPRTTITQVKQGQEIDYSDAQVGDLVFFKTSSRSRHVGVYIGHKQFMHASTSKGVMISRLDNPYWAGKYWQFRRVSYSPETR